MRKTETREIGGRNITIRQFGSVTGFKVFAKVGRIIAPALGELSLNEDFDPSKQIPPAMIGKMLGIVCTLLDDNDAENLAKLLLSGASASGSAGTIQLDSKEAIEAALPETSDLLMALRFSIELNFANFLKSIASASATSNAVEDAKAGTP